MFDVPALVAVGCLIVLAYTIYWVMQRIEDADQDYEARLGNIREFYREQVDDLRDELGRVRAERREEAQSYIERAEGYENRISELIRQVQNMSERIASLRKEGLPEGGNDFHIEDVPPAEPYSADLQAFVDGIVHPESKQRVENYIEMRRDHGVADEQIERELSEGLV